MVELNPLFKTDEELNMGTSNVRTQTDVSNPYSSTQRRTAAAKLNDAIDFGGELSKDDLKSTENANKIRQYMMARHGSQYDPSRANGISDDEVVEEFIEHMRYFTANTIHTGGELYWMTRSATEDQKAMANEAYGLYDNLGNVFTTGTMGDKASGVLDYVKASATDITNWTGLATGGWAKFATFAGQSAAKKSVRAAMIRAGKDAVEKDLLKNGRTKSGIAKSTIKKAEEKARFDTAASLTTGFANSKPGKELINQAALNAAKFQTHTLRLAARDKFKQTKINEAVKKSLVSTAAIDGVLAVGQDAAYQANMIDSGFQTDFNQFQSGASFFLGGVASGGQYVFGKVASTTGGVKDAKLKNKIRKSEELLGGKLLNLEWKNADAIVGENLTASVTAWRDKWKSWSAKTENSGKAPPDWSPDLMKTILLGSDPDKVGGLVDLYMKKTNGLKVNPNVKFADLMSMMTQYLTDKKAIELGKLIKEVAPHSDIGPLTNPNLVRATIGDLLGKNSSAYGKGLNALSQGKKALDAALTTSEMAMNATLRSIDKNAVLDWTPRTDYTKGQRILRNGKIYTVKENHVSTEKWNANKYTEPTMDSEPLSYSVNLWRRMLVSLPETSVLNLKGFSSIYVGNAAAEILSATQYSVAAMNPLLTKSQRTELLRMRNIYFQTQSKKFQTLLNPHDSFETFEAILDNKPEARKVLTEAYYMGIEQKGDKYGVNPEGVGFKVAEKLASVANTMSGVKLQDLFTKSQFFIPELDKFLKMKYNRSLDDVVDAGDYQLIDGEITALAVEGTQKAVFSKDYTTESTHYMLRGAAGIIEDLSKYPGLNFIMPFGRFFNSVIATAHQWGPSGLIESGAIEAVRKARKEFGEDVTPRSILDTADAQSDFNKALVGTGMLVGVTKYQFAKSDELGTFDTEGPGGTVIDQQNNYPLSLLLAAGEFLKSRIVNSRDYDKVTNEWTFKNINNVKNSFIVGDASPEALENVMTQIGLGQSKTNVQFGSDLKAIVSLFTGSAEGKKKEIQDQFVRTGAVLFAGVTRPLGMFNDMTGMVMGYDTAKDPRRTEGLAEVFSESATRYTGHILRAVNEKLGEAIYGENSAKIITEAINSKDLVTARRTGRISGSSNPIAKVLGVKIKQGKTNTEALMAVLGKNDWQLDPRSNQKELDTAYSELMGPYLDKQAHLLLSSKKFMSKNENDKRAVFVDLLGRLKKDVKSLIDVSSHTDQSIYQGKAKLRFQGYTRETKKAALDYIEGLGLDNEIRDMPPDVIFKLIQFAELYKLDTKIDADNMQFRYTN